MKRILYICIALLFVVNGYSQSGQDGNVSWEIVDSTLTLTGTGAMKDYDYTDNRAPWYPHRSLIKTVVVEHGLTTIGNSAFALCSALANIAINDSVTSIGDNAFLVCRNLTAISLPDSTKTIGALAFGACSGLTSIDIPAEVSYIGEGAFSGCSSLSAINVDADNGVYKDVDGIVFSKDEKELLIYPAGKEASSYTVPDHVTALGYGAFINCENLTRLELQDSLTTIGREAFYNCSNLSIVIIPGTVTTIGDNAFQYCSSLDTIEVYWSAPITLSPAIYTASSIATATLSIPAGTKETYEDASVWSNFGSISERERGSEDEGDSDSEGDDGGENDSDGDDEGEGDDDTANSPLSLSKVSVSYAGGMLSVDSPHAETLSVYSLTGALVHTAAKGEGRAVFALNQPAGIYILTGSTGWNVKVAVTGVQR